MFIKISISIKVFFYFSLYFLLFAVLGCNSDGNPSQRKLTQQKIIVPEDSLESIAEFQALTEKTARKFLEKYAKQNPLENRFKIQTSFGEIQIELYTNTPLHLANFNLLFDKRYFNDTWFYRVSENHVIQAGNTDGRQTVDKRNAIGMFTIPAEALDKNLHIYGAVAAARSYKNNPDKESDPYEFYIVLGKQYSNAELRLMSDKYSFDLSVTKIETYAKQGGAPHLDGEHTVFGRVTKGMDVVEKIAKQPTDEGEWPLMNIPIQIKRTD